MILKSIRCIVTMIAAGMQLGVQPCMAGDIHEAIKRGDFERVRSILESNPDTVNDNVTVDQTGLPLNVAVRCGNPAIVRFLLERRANVNAEGGRNRQRPVFDAENPRVMKILIEFGVDLMVVNSLDETPLQNAAHRGLTKIARVLADAGADVPPEIAAAMGWKADIEAMLRKDPSIARPPSSLLFAAAATGQTDIVKLLLDFGADPNCDRRFINVLGRCTPLSDAVKGDHYETAKLLCERGADTNVSADRNHASLFLFALAYLDIGYSEQMLKYGVDVQRGESLNDKTTPLHVVSALGGGAGSVHRVRLGQPLGLSATRAQALEKAQLLVEHGANVDAMNSDGATPLLFGAISGNTDLCVLLLSRGAMLDFGSACLMGKRDAAMALLLQDSMIALNTKQPLRTSPLHWAVRGGDLSLVSLLLKRGDNPNIVAPRLVFKDSAGFSVSPQGKNDAETPLHLATQFASVKIARELIDHGADVEAKDEDGNTPLMLACRRNEQSMVHLLLSCGASTRIANISGETALHFAQSKEIAELLLGAGAEVDAVRSGDSTPLHDAARAGNAELATFLRGRGAKVDLFCACVFDWRDDAKRILDQNATRFHAADRDSPLNAIDLVAAHNSIDVLQCLIDNGSPFWPPNESKSRPLHIAAQYGHLPLAEILLSRGLPVDLRLTDQSTALHHAAQGAWPDMVAFLLRRQADINAIDASGSSALDYLLMRSKFKIGHREEHHDSPTAERELAVAKLLLDSGTNIEGPNGRGFTPLHTAARFAPLYLVDLLLERGADVNARDWADRTALEIADEQNRNALGRISDRKPIIEVLRRHASIVKKVDR